jgi:WD repeat-containing protein 35
MVITWNQNFRKLTTSDQNGLIIVWMLHRGIWFEEMINNRNRSVVRDMKWGADYQKICIIYEDGAVIVGTVDGQRLWGKEIKTQLALVEWSPDGKNILFCTLGGEVHVYDNEGIYSHRVPIYCLDNGSEGSVAIAGIDWYDGGSGPDNQVPTLCIGFDNGRVQIMRSDSDDKPVLIDTLLRCTGLKWDPNGHTVAIAGMQTQSQASAGAGDREVGVVQFYAPSGQHLRTLRVPGSNLRSISWEGNGLRLALAVDSHIFFANIRPDYLWGYFSHTLVYAVLKKERSEHTVVFWDTQSEGQEKYTKYIKHVTHIRSSDDYCTLVTKADDSSGQYIIIICNDIGSPVDSKYLQIEPLHLSMTNSHVVVASEDCVYIWMYRGSVSKQAQNDLGVANKRRVEMMFHIDESFAPGSGMHDKEGFVLPTTPVQDPIACLTATENCFLVARESGAVQRYSLPHLGLESRFTIKCRPQVIAVNCDGTRMSVIDINGLLTLYNIEIKPGGGVQQETGQQLEFERKDVWNMRWASDNPDLFAIMEKTRMYIVRGLQPEEPVLSNAYICAFKDLQIQSVLIDEVIQNPESPRKEVLLDFETKSLRDTRDILTKVSNLKDAFNYVEANPHRRLWRLLAEAALDALDFSIAEKAFVRFEDYQGIQLVKRLRLLDDRVKQKAEVAAYFQRFDEAENLYREIDRKDLAIDLRVRIGDWKRVLQLLQHGGNEELLQQAWSAIGDYFADRGKWSNAAQHYVKAGNNAALVDTYYFLEDYDALERLIPNLPEGSQLLLDIGNKFTSVGLCEQAVQAFLHYGDVKTAVDTCVLLNQWDLAVQHAQQQNFQQIEGLLAKYAQHLLDKNKKVEAVQLYRKANRHPEAAKLLSQMAREMPGGAQKSPDRIKKLYLLAALEVEKHKTKTLDVTAQTLGTVTTAQTVQSLITADQSIGGDRELEAPWRGCEAYHLYLLAQRQLYESHFEAAMKTALRLADYEDILDTQTVFSLIGLTTYYNKFFTQCSKAFIKLEASSDIHEEMRVKFGDLALRIFTRNRPVDNASSRLVPCPKCDTRMHDFNVSCPNCNHRLPFCVASGRSIFPEDRGGHDGGALGGASAVMKCRTCRHRMYVSEVRKLRNCPLCHSRLDMSAFVGPDAQPTAHHPRY